MYLCAVERVGAGGAGGGAGAGAGAGGEEAPRRGGRGTTADERPAAGGGGAPAASGSPPRSVAERRRPLSRSTSVAATTPAAGGSRARGRKSVRVVRRRVARFGIARDRGVVVRARAADDDRGGAATSSSAGSWGEARLGRDRHHLEGRVAGGGRARVRRARGVGVRGARVGRRQKERGTCKKRLDETAAAFRVWFRGNSFFVRDHHPTCGRGDDPTVYWRLVTPLGAWP